MALTDYNSLQAAVAAWTNRDDLAAVIPDFIAMAESRIAKVVRHRKMLKRVQTTLDEPFENLPNDFLQLVSCVLPGSPNHTPEFVQAPAFSALAALNEAPGTPRYYTLVGTTIEFAPRAAGNPLFEMVYYAAVPALSATNSSVWLLAEAPELYLYGALLQAAAYVGDEDRAEHWKALFDQQAAALNAADRQAQHTASGTVPAPTPVSKD